jgi:VIT1/CCC1 family predicted Fe2+/Mn2+ transporter
VRGHAAVRRWRRRLADEHLEAAVYRELAARRTGEEREILLALAAAETRHIAHWEALLAQGATDRRPGRPSLRSRVLALLARRFGSVFVLAIAQRAEGRSPYAVDDDATAAMAADERVHEEIVRGLAARGRAQVSGTFRAAVFGANDGLVSNLALVLGVSGGGAPPRVVLLTGIVGLLAGALSMGAGEYVSVRSQRELLDAATPVSVASAVVPHLDVDANELALVYRARGMTAEQAQQRADAHFARAAGHAAAHGPGAVPAPELPAAPADGGEVASGVVGSGVVGSGLGAAASSFAFFAVGALVPVAPFLLGLGGTAALVVACTAVGLALLATGAVVGLLSGGPPLRRALRQLAVGAGAAAVTYLLGLAFGVATG